MTYINFRQLCQCSSDFFRFQLVKLFELSAAEIQGHYIAACFYRIDVVGVRLHHRFTFFNKLFPVVSLTVLIFRPVRQLSLDNLVSVAEAGPDDTHCKGPESMPSVPAAVAHSLERLQDCPIRSRPSMVVPVWD